MNTLGTLLKLTSYGESHGDAVGAILDQFPADFEIDIRHIQAQLARRRPGQSKVTTTRDEADLLHINSGLFEGRTTGAPIHFFIKNNNAKPSDYKALKEVYRPSHADFTYEERYGLRDHRGGGRSSARITAAWVAAGALAQQYLEANYGIKLSAYIVQIGQTKAGLSGYYAQSLVDETVVRCPDPSVAAEMISAIEEAQSNGDSLGGKIQLCVLGLSAGIGNPVFDKLSAKMGHAMLSINAVKGFEVGGGFDMISKKGSEVNDAFIQEDGNVKTASNNSGGIQGGISNGMDLSFGIGFKPTASIAQAQRTINRQGESTELKTEGRHDPCVVPRAVPIVECLGAFVVLDAILSSGKGLNF